MEHGKNMVKQALDAQAKVFQVAPSGARQIGTASRAVVIPPDMADGVRGWISYGASRSVVVTSDVVRSVIGRPRFGVTEAIAITPDTAIAKPSGKHESSAFNQMQGRDAFRDASLRFRRIFSQMLSGGKPLFPSNTWGR